MHELPPAPQVFVALPLTQVPLESQQPEQFDVSHAALVPQPIAATEPTSTEITIRDVRMRDGVPRTPMSLAALIPAAWKRQLRNAIAAPSFTQLEKFVDAEWATATVFPPKAQVFAALELTKPEDVRIVLLGQDPYPTKGNANGLAFSVTRDVKIPASLKNVFTALHRERGLPMPTNGDLTPWARRGVLLLNTVLTVREKTPQSHQKRGWEAFTTEVLRVVAAQQHTVVFLCLGKPAQKLYASLGTSQPMVAAPHPSPLNGSAFVDHVVKEQSFTRVDELLGAPFDWSL